MNTDGVYIVTGATGGIGRAITKALAARGCRVVLACRNTDKAERFINEPDSGGMDCDILPVDLSSLSSVREAAVEAASRHYKINALINNAGTMPGRLTITDDGYEEATQTNFIATALFSRLLAPLISTGGSVVFTTSMTRHIVKLRTDWLDRAVSRHGRFTTYGRSKLMLTHFALDFADELKPRGIRVNCSDPGIVDSSIITMDNTIVNYLSDRLFRPLISTPAQGAEPVMTALKSRLTGCIFTRRGVNHIPKSYMHNPLHALPASAVKDLM
mgnify:FL=1